MPLRGVARGSRATRSLDYIARMARRKIDAVASMHAHWNTYLDPDLLGASRPPEFRLAKLRAARHAAAHPGRLVGLRSASRRLESRARPRAHGRRLRERQLVYLHALLRHLRTARG